MRIELENNKKWVFNVGEKVRFSLCISSEYDFKDIGYRSRLFTSSGQSVTVLMAPRLFSISSNEEKMITLEADLSMLVPGKYYLSPTLYGVNEYGGWQFYDHLDGAVVFEIIANEEFNENMEWEQRWWGNVQFPPILKINERSVQK